MIICCRIFVYDLDNKGFVARLFMKSSISRESGVLIHFHSLIPCFY